MALTRVPVPYAPDLAALVTRYVRDNISGLRDEIARVTGGGYSDPFVKPNVDGTWPRQDRATTRTLMWLRAIDDATLAPMPTVADGYVVGDLIYPVDTATTGGGPTMLWSDSLSVPAAVDLASRATGDAYAGGSTPTWAADTTAATGGGYISVQPGLGMDMYSGVYARVTAPALPTAGTVRSRFTIASLNPGNGLSVVLRGTSYNAASTTRVRLLNNNGRVEAALLSGSSTATPTLIGSAPLTPGDTVVGLTVTGTSVSVAFDGVIAGTASVPSTYSRLSTWPLWVPANHAAAVANIMVEVL